MRAEAEVVPMRQSAIGRFQPASLEEAMRVAEMLAKSTIIPKHLMGKPGDILATLVAGAEMGLQVMEALRAIYMVNGKVGFYADFIVAKAMAHPECECFRLVEEESNDKQAVYVAKRRGQKEQRLVYTIEQAKRAGLLSNATWAKHTEAMLRARCASAIAKIVFPDSMYGIYSKDEVDEMREVELNPPPKPAATRVDEVRQQLVSKGLMEEPPKALPMPTLGFGPLKGTPLGALEMSSLSTAVDEARAKLQAEPEAKWAPKLRANLEELEKELETRLATDAAQTEEGP